ncbi:MAG: lytic transglycosylase domain-containing protein [Solirubrobacteraceae bacterium]|jgi:soluble lytic murein transglycosylase-like protein
MSAQSLGGVATGIAAGELAVAQRVQQLQALIESARQVAGGGLPASTLASPAGAQSSNTNFASALQAATTADAASVAGASGAAYQPVVQGGAGSGEAGGEYESLIDQAASRNGLDPAVLHGLIEQESGFDPSATSSAGASGLTQLMPGTASSLGVTDPLDPAESIEGGARYLGQLMTQFGGNTEDALAAYNAGPGAVQQYGGIPPYAETQSYVTKVLGYAEAYRQSHPATVTGALA